MAPRLLAFLLILSASESLRGEVLITSPSFAELAAAVRTESHIRLEFDGAVIFPEPIIIDRTVSISGAGNSVAFDGRGLNQLFVINAAGSLTLKALTLENSAKVGQPTETVSGGAIDIQGGSVYVENCIFRRNTLRGGDAVVESMYPPPYTVYTGYPGGFAFGSSISVRDGRLQIENAKFFENVATGGNNAGTQDFDARGGAGYGGAIYASNSIVHISNSEFAENRVFGAPGAFGRSGLGRGSLGGAFYLFGGEATISRSEFKRNHAENGSGGSMALSPGYPIAAPVIISTSLFDGNFATVHDGGFSSGGAIFSDRQIQLKGSLFLRNSATSGRSGYSIGGGARLFNGVIENCIFADNLAEGQAGTRGSYWGQGSGVYIEIGPLRITHSTFVGNLSRRGPYPQETVTIGGTIQVEGNAVAELQATVISAGEGPATKGVITDLGFNVASDASAPFTSASSVNSVNPRLRAATEGFGLYRPELDSPAVDRVTELLAATDIRGAVRGPLQSDSGAVEVGGAISLTAQVISGALRVRSSSLDPVRLLWTSDFLTWTEESSTSPPRFGAESQLDIPITAGHRFFVPRLE